MPTETVIRDKLSKSLAVLEPGLKLIEVNHKLPNPIGPKGFVDILARDRFKNFVIIELKRSNESARDAFLEILKYMPLFRATHGIQPHQVRCLIVSTTWRELLVPYSEFQRLCEGECQTEGIEIMVNAAGKVTRSKRVDVYALDETASVFQSHSVFLYRQSRDRAKAISRICTALDEAGATGYLVLKLDYRGENDQVIYPHSVYVVPTKVEPGVMKRLASKAVEELGDESSDAELERNYREDSFLAYVSEAMAKQPTPKWSTFEIGHAMKFAGMVENLGWKVKAITRKGPFSSATVIPDDQIVNIIKGFAGANPVRFERLVSPSYKLDWADTRKAAANCLSDTAWEPGFNWFLDRIEQHFPNGVVLARIFNPRLLPEVLYHLTTEADPSYLPMLLVDVSSRDGQKHEGLVGTITWNGTTKPKNIKAAFAGVPDGFEGYYMARVTGGVFDLNQILMKRHGLGYSMWRISYDGGNTKVEKRIVISRAGEIQEKKAEPKPLFLTDFVEANEQYIRDLIRRTDGFVGRGK